MSASIVSDYLKFAALDSKFNLSAVDAFDGFVTLTDGVESVTVSVSHLLSLWRGLPAKWAKKDKSGMKWTEIIKAMGVVQA